MAKVMGWVLVRVLLGDSRTQANIASLGDKKERVWTLD